MKTSLVDNMDLTKLNKQDIELLRKLEYNLINDNKPIEVEFQGVMTLIFDDDNYDNDQNESNNENYYDNNSVGLVGAAVATSNANNNLTTKSHNIILSSASSTTSHDTSNGYCSMDAEDNTNNNSIIGIALQQYNNQATSHNLLSSPVTNKSIHNSQKRKLKSVTTEKTDFGYHVIGSGAVQSFMSEQQQQQQQQRQRKINEISFSYTLKSFREAIIIPDGHGY